MVAWGAIGSALGKVGAGIGKVASKVGAGIGKVASKVGPFLSKNSDSIGNVAGALLGGLNLGSSGGTDVGASKSLMDYQFDLQKDYTQWLNENQWRHMRTGLENAGYNPLLALGATPASGAIGIGSAVSGNTSTFSGADAFNSLLSMANVANVKSDTDSKLLGKLGSLLGTKYGNKVSSVIDDILKNIQNTADFNNEIQEAGENVLKGYVSNDASFDYAPEYDELGKLPKELSRYH